MQPQMPRAIRAYVDGSCLGNPGLGGWAVVLETDEHTTEWFRGSGGLTTNNRMELEAALSAILEAERLGVKPGGLHIFTDSQYVVHGATIWKEKWQTNGWKDQKGRSIKNKELWLRLLGHLEKVQPEWTWIRGHSGQYPLHTRADELARCVAKSQV